MRQCQVTSLDDMVETLWKIWSWGCPGTEAARNTMHPKLEPILEVASCAATELMWAIRRVTDDIVDMVSSRVRLENQGKVRSQSSETFPNRRVGLRMTAMIVGEWTTFKHFRRTSTISVALLRSSSCYNFTIF